VSILWPVLISWHGNPQIVDTRQWNNPGKMGKPLEKRLAQILLGAITRAMDSED